jgi:ABC-type transport system substrate-binding protein
MKAAALLVKDQCADAGITINILDMEFAQWLTTRKAGVCPISTTHWSGDYFDSYAYFFNFLSSTGDSETPEYQYSNPEADALLQEAAVEQDEAKRNAIYLQLQEIAAEDAMVVLYGTLAEDAVIRPNVHGFQVPGIIPRCQDLNPVQRQHQLQHQHPHLHQHRRPHQHLHQNLRR